MPFTVTMPKLSPTMETGTIAKWHVKEGDKVNAGDTLMEVSTDKATVEYAALDEGTLRKILVSEGKEASVNQPIAIFSEDPSESIEGYMPENVAAGAEEKQAAPVEVKKETVSAATKTSERVIASPLAKKVAKEKGIDLTKIQGSGPRGRIVAKDLEAAPRERESELKPSGTYKEIPLTPIRRVIGQRLQESKSTIPHFYVTQTVDASELIRLREQLSHLEIKISFNDCVIKAVALALKEHPTVNSGFNPDKQTILQYETIDISVAVSVEAGLITPIVTHADQKSLTEISAEVRTLAKKAKEGKLALHEFQGGSFTVSNMGMFGVTEFQAIINPPQCAILAIAGIQDMPFVKDGVVVAGKGMNITLSADHRVIDGVAGAQFIKTVQKYLENPVLLMIR